MTVKILILFDFMISAVITMYPTWMKILFLYYDFWGFCTLYKTPLRKPKYYRVIFAFHLFLVTFATVGIFLFLFRPINDVLGHLIDSLKLCAHLLVYWISIFELYLKQQTQQKFWNILNFIDKHLCSHRFNCFKSSYLLKIIVYFVIIMTFLLNYVIILFSMTASNKSSYYFWFCYALIVLFHKHQAFYYLFYLEIIKYELKMVRNELDEMWQFCENQEMKSTKQFAKVFQCKRFKWIRELYESIYDMNDVVNTVFGWSNIVAISFSFLLILADINWLYWKSFNKYRIDRIGKLLNVMG